MSRQSSVGVGIWGPPQHCYKHENGYNQDSDEDEEEEDLDDEEDENDEEEGDDDDDDNEDDDDDDDGDDEGNMASGGRKRKRNQHETSTPSSRVQGLSNADCSPSKRKGSEDITRDDSATAGSPASVQNFNKKPKAPRGSKACTHCRKLKMRCTGGESGPPCNRCRHSGYKCVFEESNRGKKAAANAAAAAQAKAEKAAQNALNNPVAPTARLREDGPFSSGAINRKSKGKDKQSSQDLARSLEKMEHTLNTVLKALKDPSHAAYLGHASGMLTRPQSPEVNLQDRPAHHRTYNRPHPPSHTRVADLSQSTPTSIAPSQLTAPGTSAVPGRHSGPSQSQSARYALNPSDTTPGVMPASVSSSSHSHHGSTSSGSRARPPNSPRLHSLPPDSLNPLGLLAEASLGNQICAVRRSKTSSSTLSTSDDADKGVDGTAKRSGRDTTGNEDGTINGVMSGKTVGFEKDKEDDKMARSNTPALGVASKTYFRPGPMSMLPLRKVIIDRELPPELLTSGTVSDQEVLDLFSIFFHNCAQHIVLLDPEWHTPQFVCGRSPFLFTVILAIASRFYTRRPDLHAKCLRQATKEAFSCLERGFKSVEIVQAFLLLTLWGKPAQRFEEDKSWIFAGIAFRIATDLNLHRKSIASLTIHPNVDDATVMEREKEIRNRERTWIFCFVVDRSLSGQMGKPSVIREDFILRNTPSWALHRTAQPADVALSALVELQRVTSKHTELLYSSVTSITGLNHDLDFSAMIKVFSDQLEEWRHHWTLRGLVIGDCHNRHPQIPPPDGTLSAKEIELRQLYSAANRSTPPPDDADHTMRTLYYLIQQAPLRFHYAMLSLHSFGLQFGQQIDKGVQFLRCYDAARGIFFAARDGMRPILRYISDTQILIISFSLVFMLKLTRPTFASYADSEEIFQLVEEGADMLEEVAAGPSHTPALYAYFLRATLAQAKADHAARSSSAFPSRAASPGGPPTNGAADAFDTTTMATAAFDLPADPALGAGADGGLGPFPAGGNRPSVLSEAALVQAFSAAATGNGTLAGPNFTGFAGAGGIAGSNGGGATAGSEMGHTMLDHVWWNQLVPAGLGGPMDGFNGSIDMQPLNGAGVTQTPAHGASTSGAAPGDGETTQEDGLEAATGVTGMAIGVSGAGNGETAAENAGASGGQERPKPNATTGAGTGVTRPSSPSSGNVLTQFGGNFLNFDSSYY